MHKILANTLFLGKDIHYMTECHSTNDIAAVKIKEGTAKEGSIVITDKQTKGRGQRGNKWYSEPGMNLTFSLVLRPDFLSVGDHFYLNAVVSLAVKEALGKYTSGIQVKWPNDMVHKSRGKLGGILIENTIAQQRIATSVVGLGLNINQTDFAFPGPTSLAVLSGAELDKWEVMEGILCQLERRYIQLKKGGAGEILEDYLSDLFQKEKWAEYEDGSGRFEGKITGISPEGKLTIQKKEGNYNHYAFKEVKFL